MIIMKYIGQNRLLIILYEIAAMQVGSRVSYHVDYM